MLLSVFVLVLTCAGPPNTFAFKKGVEINVLDSWGSNRRKRDDTMTIKDKFPIRATVSCEGLHLTDEAPFTAIILYKTSGRLLCMGSIVDPSHVLSAKKCFEKFDYNEVKVLVGYYKAYWGEYSQVKEVEHVIRHEYELVLLRLDEPITLTDHIQTVRFPSSITKKVEDFGSAFPPPYKIVGFMVDRFDTPGDFIDKEKLYTLREDSYIPISSCKDNYTKFHLEPAKLFCTLGNATFCWGGWGSPVLKWIHATYFVQVGVVISDSCSANATGPFLAARTDSYIDWIRGNSFHGHQSG